MCPQGRCSLSWARVQALSFSSASTDLAAELTWLPERPTCGVPASPPVPRQAVLLVNVHSRRGQELFDEAVQLLHAEGVELLAQHAIHQGDDLRPNVRE